MSDDAPAPIDLSEPKWRDKPQLLRDELAARLAAGIVVDGDVARPLDTLLVQLLVAARRASDGAGGRFELRNPSDRLREGLSILGLHDELLT